MKKIGNFFVAMVPFWIYFASQFVVSFIMGMVFAISAVVSGSEMVMGVKELMIMTAVAQVISFVAAIITMLASKTKMRDMSPVHNDNIHNGRIFRASAHQFTHAFGFRRYGNGLNSGSPFRIRSVHVLHGAFCTVC